MKQAGLKLDDTVGHSLNFIFFKNLANNVALELISISILCCILCHWCSHSFNDLYLLFSSSQSL